MKTMKVMYDSLSFNTGDIAIGLATRDLLAMRGVFADNANPVLAHAPKPHIIGGGELLRARGDEFYDRFRIEGQHLLNAVGVNYDSDDLEYLNEYAFVSARTSVEAEILGRFDSRARVLPCSTTLWGRQIAQVRDSSKPPVLGIHLVPHSYRVIEDLAETINEVDAEKVFFSFTPYNGDLEFMKSLPLDLSRARFAPAGDPTQLFHQIGQFSGVISTSLHASIFAYTQNVPFVSIKQTKVFDYFSDRGLAENVVETRRDLRKGIERLLVGTDDYSALVDQDCVEISEAFDIFAEHAWSENDFAAPTQGAFTFSHSPEAVTLHARQSKSVIRDHDLAFAHADARRRESEAALRELRARLAYLKRHPLALVALAIRMTIRNVLTSHKSRNPD
jgi:hypothetical protein